LPSLVSVAAANAICNGLTVVFSGAANQASMVPAAIGSSAAGATSSAKVGALKSPKARAISTNCKSVSELRRADAALSQPYCKVSNELAPACIAR